MGITLDDQIKEIQRELALRQKLYPGFVARKKLTEGQAAYHIAAIQAVLVTLEQLQEATVQPRLFP